VYGAPKGALSTIFADALREYFAAHPLAAPVEQPDADPAA
jgi:hypothetical protein